VKSIGICSSVARDVNAVGYPHQGYPEDNKRDGCQQSLESHVPANRAKAAI
jgi:hypothetical protein